MHGQHLDIYVVVATVDVLVLDAQVREMDLFIEVREIVLASPPLDLVWLTIGVPVVVVAVAIVLVEPLLVVALELVVQDHAFDARAALLQAFGFAFEGAIDLDVVLQFSLAFDACVEGLAAIPITVTMALEHVTSLFGERHGVIPRAGDPSRLDKPVFAEMSKVARSRIGRTIVVVSEITTGDHSKRADGRQCSRFRAAQRVLAITIAHNLSLKSSRQVEVAREDIPLVTIAVAKIRSAIACVIEIAGIKIQCSALQ